MQPLEVWYEAGPRECCPQAGCRAVQLCPAGSWCGHSHRLLQSRSQMNCLQHNICSCKKAGCLAVEGNCSWGLTLVWPWTYIYIYKYPLVWCMLVVHLLVLHKRCNLQCYIEWCVCKQAIVTVSCAACLSPICHTFMISRVIRNQPMTAQSLK